MTDKDTKKDDIVPEETIADTEPEVVVDDMVDTDDEGNEKGAQAKLKDLREKLKKAEVEKLLNHAFDFIHDSADGLWFALKGLGLAMGVYFVLYVLHAMGAGDVKLMAAVGAAVGPMNWLGILVLTSLSGAVAGLLLVAFKGRFRKTIGNVGIILVSLGRGRAPYKESPELDVSTDQGLRLPHGALIALGTLGFLAAALRWAPR